MSKDALCPEGYSAARVLGTKGWLTECPNMKSKEGDTDMECERYECKVCGRRERLYYDEMR